MFNASCSSPSDMFSIGTNSVIFSIDIICFVELPLGSVIPPSSSNIPVNDPMSLLGVVHIIGMVNSPLVNGVDILLSPNAAISWAFSVWNGIVAEPMKRTARDKNKAVTFVVLNLSIILLYTVLYKHVGIRTKLPLIS